MIDAAETVLFRKKQVDSNAAAARKADKSYELVGGLPKTGDLVRNKVNHQVGTLAELRDKRATVKIGNMPFKVNIDDWVVVRQRVKPQGK